MKEIYNKSLQEKYPLLLKYVCKHKYNQGGVEDFFLKKYEKYV